MHDTSTLKSGPQGTEFFLGAIVAYGRNNLTPPLSVEEVALPHSAPADLSEHRRVLRPKVRLNAAVAMIRFPSAALDAPLVRGDPRLERILLRTADEELGRLRQVGSWSERVRAALAAADPTGGLSFAQLARTLAQGERTLRRRLSEEGTSHQQLLDEVRQELAMRLLRQHDLTAAEVAILTGFSEPAAFSRTFRRWTRLTPLEYRRTLER